MNVSQDFAAGSSNVGLLDAQKWLSARLQEQFRLVSSTGTWPTSTAASTAPYVTEVYAFKDSAQASAPIYFRIAYHYGSNSSAAYAHPALNFAYADSLIGNDLATSTLALVPLNQNTQPGSTFRMTLVAHSSGFLLSFSHSGSSPVCYTLRFGRVRLPAPSGASAIFQQNGITSSATLINTPGNKLMFAGSAGAPSLPSAARTTNGDSLLLPAIVTTPSGILEPAYAPLEFLHSSPTDWAGGSSRRVLIGRSLVTLAAPVNMNGPVGSGYYGGLSSSLVGLCPSEDLT